MSGNDGAAGEPTDEASDLRDRAEALIDVEGLWSGQIIYTAVELGLLDHLGRETATASTLASEYDLDRDRTSRLLRALAHFGVLEPQPDHAFAITPLGERFLPDAPESVRPNLRFNRHPAWIAAMVHLPAVVAGEADSGFEREFGRDFFSYLRDAQGLHDRYDALMEYASRDVPGQVLDALSTSDVDQISHLCDVGGGRGHLLCHLLDALPHLDGTVLDRPSVVGDAADHWASSLGVADRCRFVGGDMFTSVPRADAYLLKWILHNFDDERCVALLETIHEAAPSDARLFIVETPLPGPCESHDVERLDIVMMVQTGGRERTVAEYETLLRDGGWERRTTRVPEGGELAVIEAEKR